MSKKKLLAGAMVAALVVGMPAFSENVSLSELEEIKAATHIVKESGKEFDKNHWAYQSLKNISRKYGLLLGDANEKFSGSQALTRNEAAVILVNLLGKIESEKIKLTDPEATKVQIMKNEFSTELGALTGRIAKVEDDVKTLKGSVDNLEAKTDKTFTHYFGEDFKIGGYLAMTYNAKLNQGDPSVDTTPDNLRVAISEFRFSGKLYDHIYYLASMNAHRTFSSSANGLLGDIFIRTDALKNHNIYIGQTRIPVGHEGALSPTSLDTTLRAQIGRNFGDFRDTGIKVAGNHKFVDYYLGLYNGAGMNTSDQNGDVAGGGFVYFKPLANVDGFGELRLGGGMYKSTSNDNDAAVRYHTDSFGFYGDYKIGDYTVKAEYARKDGHNSTAGQIAEGFYITNLYDLNDKWQLVARYDMFDKDIGVKNNNSTEWTGGVNYFLRGKSLKFQLNGTYIANDGLKDSVRLGLLSQYLF